MCKCSQEVQNALEAKAEGRLKIGLVDVCTYLWLFAIFLLLRSFAVKMLDLCSEAAVGKLKIDVVILDVDAQLHHVTKKLCHILSA